MSPFFIFRVPLRENYRVIHARARALCEKRNCALTTALYLFVYFVNPAWKRHTACAADLRPGSVAYGGAGTREKLEKPTGKRDISESV